MAKMETPTKYPKISEALRLRHASRRHLNKTKEQYLAEHRERERLRRLANPEAYRARDRARAEKRRADGTQKEYTRKWRLTRNFGITEEDYESMLRVCPDCAICGKLNPKGQRLSVDHCHKTGRVRGLLCFRCNPAIGLFLDSPELLRKAIEYLRGPGDNKMITEIERPEARVS